MHNTLFASCYWRHPHASENARPVADGHLLMPYYASRTETRWRELCECATIKMTSRRKREPRSKAGCTKFTLRSSYGMPIRCTQVNPPVTRKCMVQAVVKSRRMHIIVKNSRNNQHYGGLLFAKLLKPTATAGTRPCSHHLITHRTST